MATTKTIWTQADAERLASLRARNDLFNFEAAEMRALEMKFAAVVAQERLVVEHATAVAAEKACGDGPTFARASANVIHDLDPHVAEVRSAIEDALISPIKRERLARLSPIMVKLNALLHRAIGQAWRVAQAPEGRVELPRELKRVVFRAIAEAGAEFVRETRAGRIVVLAGRDEEGDAVRGAPENLARWGTEVITFNELRAALQHHAIDVPERMAAAIFSHAKAARAEARRGEEG